MLKKRLPDVGASASRRPQTCRHGRVRPGHPRSPMQRSGVWMAATAVATACGGHDGWGIGAKDKTRSWPETLFVPEPSRDAVALGVCEGRDGADVMVQAHIQQIERIEFRRIGLGQMAVLVDEAEQSAPLHLPHRREIHHIGEQALLLLQRVVMRMKEVAGPVAR